MLTLSSDVFDFKERMSNFFVIAHVKNSNQIAAIVIIFDICNMSKNYFQVKFSVSKQQFSISSLLLNIQELYNKSN